MGKRGSGWAEPQSGRCQGNWCERETSPQAPARAGSAESRWGRGALPPGRPQGCGGAQGTQGPAREAVRDLAQQQWRGLEHKGAGPRRPGWAIADLRLVLRHEVGAWSRARPI